MELSEQIVQVGLALALIIVLVVGLGFAVRRLNSGSFKSAGDIRIVASTFLGAKERVLLLEVKDRHVLIGVTPQGMTSLGDFARSQGENHSPGEGSHSGFQSVLKEAGA